MADAFIPLTHLDLRPMLVPERRAFTDLLTDLDSSEWEASTECPAWSVKGIALHILGDDLSLLARQRDEAVPGTLLYAEDHAGVGFRALLDGFNEQWVHAALFLSPGLIVELLRVTGDWTAGFYDSVSPEALGEPVGFIGATGPSPYWQISAREYVERWAHHQQVLRAVGRPDLGPELLGPAADVVFTALAAHLPDLGAGPTARVAIVIPDLGRWMLRRDADRWVPIQADPGSASTVTLTLDAAQAAAALSRGLTRTEVEAAFSIAGDAALGEGAVAAVARFAGRPPTDRGSVGAG